MGLESMIPALEVVPFLFRGPEGRFQNGIRAHATPQSAHEKSCGVEMGRNLKNPPQLKDSAQLRGETSGDDTSIDKHATSEEIHATDGLDQLVKQGGSTPHATQGLAHRT